METTHQAYIDRQNSVYEEFRRAPATLTHLSADPNVLATSAGYIIAFRHPDSIMEPYNRFTAKLRQIVPSLSFDANNGHTTITVFQKQKLAHFQSDPAILEALQQTVACVSTALWQSVRIDFRDWYFNAETVIVAGQPNAAFWEVGQQIQQAGMRYSLDLRMPWGAHMTAARFTVPGDSGTVTALRHCLQDAPLLGTSIPSAIHLGIFFTNATAFTLHTTSSWNRAHP